MCIRDRSERCRVFDIYKGNVMLRRQVGIYSKTIWTACHVLEHTVNFPEPCSTLRTSLQIRISISFVFSVIQTVRPLLEKLHKRLSSHSFRNDFLYYCRHHHKLLAAGVYFPSGLFRSYMCEGSGRPIVIVWVVFRMRPVFFSDLRQIAVTLSIKEVSLQRSDSNLQPAFFSW